MKARDISLLAITVYGAMQKFEEFTPALELCLNSSHETVLEIGSGRGGTLWAWSHLPKNKNVISVDLPGGDFGGGLTEEDKERIQNWIDPKQNTILIAGDSHSVDTLKEVHEALSICGVTKVDILFIDGDHTYEGVKKDFEMYSPLVKEGGLILFHDIVDHTEVYPTCKVDKFWNDIKKEAREEFEFYEFVAEPKTWGGIGVIKKNG